MIRCLRLQLPPRRPSVEEGEDATFTVTLNGQAEADIVVTLTPSPGSGLRAAEAADYVTGSVSVTFETGDSVKTLLLGTREDEVYEGDEEVALDFSISGPATKASAPSTLTIEDDDSAPSISFTLASSEIAEDAANPRHEIELTLNGALAEDDITVAFMITGSATMEWLLTRTTR